MPLSDIKKRAALVCSRVLQGALELLAQDGPEQELSGVIRARHAELHFSPSRIHLNPFGPLGSQRARGLFHYHADQGREIQALSRDGHLETYTFYRRSEEQASFVCWYQQVRINRQTGEVSYRENDAWYEWALKAG